jgi:hypothetical protein
MSLHFIGSKYSQAGKSWFIRGAIEYFYQKLEPAIVIDAGADKFLGQTYNPKFNDSYNLRFGENRGVIADRLIEIAETGISALVKVPAPDNQHFEDWIETIEIDRLDVPTYYWFVSNGRDRLPPKISSFFGDRVFIVQNRYFDENLKYLQQPSYKPEQQIILPKFGCTPADSYEIESSKNQLAHLQASPDLSTLMKSRIYRFVEAVNEELTRTLVLT